MADILQYLPPLARHELTKERLEVLGEFARLREELDQQTTRAEAAEAELRDAREIIRLMEESEAKREEVAKRELRKESGA